VDLEFLLFICLHFELLRIWWTQKIICFQTKLKLFLQFDSDISLNTRYKMQMIIFTQMMWNPHSYSFFKKLVLLC